MSQLSRRNFLRTSLFGAAGVALASGSVSPMVLLAEDSVAANDKIQCAVLGVRGRGNSHISGFLKNPHTVVTYIVDPDESVVNARLDQIAEKQGFRPKFVRDMREAFEDKELDVVGSATPNHWHGLSAIWAMQAGKDVYVEKPATQNLFEGVTMCAAAEKYGRICQVGTQCRSNPAQREAVAFMRDGGIGDINFARGLCYKRRKSIGALGDYTANIPGSVDFGLWSGPAVFTDPKLTRPNFHYDWHWQRLYGNGDSGNQGPHQLDIARWGLGLMRHPNSVITYGGRLGYQAERKDAAYVDAGDTPNTEVSIFDYGDRTIVFETRGLETPALDGAKVGVIFYGSKGKLVQESYGKSVAYDLEGNVTNVFTGGGDQLHFDNFIDAVISRDASSLHAPILDGHLSAAMAHLGNISYYLGENNRLAQAEIAKALEGVDSRDDDVATLQRTVDHLVENGVDLAATPLSLGPKLGFDPEKQRFTDSEAANALLNRQWREGFVCPSADEV